MSKAKWSFVLHGGCMANVPHEEEQKEIQENLDRVAQQSAALLEQGVSARDVVVAAVTALEDCPVFMACKSSASTINDTQEREACIIDGETGRFGAVSCLTKTKNPIRTANALLESGECSFVVGAEGDKMTDRYQLSTVENEHFDPTNGKDWPNDKCHAECSHTRGGSKKVGAAVLDSYGRLVVGGSTRRYSGRHNGQVGDTAIPGASLYADSSLGVLVIGDGDIIIRSLLASRVAFNKSKTFSTENSIDEALHDMLHAEGQYAVATLDKNGKVSTRSTAAAFHTITGSSGTKIQPTVSRTNLGTRTYESVYPVAKDMIEIVQTSSLKTIFPTQSWTVPQAHTLKALADPWYKALAALQNILYHSTIDYFKSRKYHYTLVPSTTNSISSPMALGSDSQPVPIMLFGETVHLADSMQLALEYLMRLENDQPGMYCISMSSRGEDPDFMHLNQFSHVECELFGDFSNAISIAESYLVSLVKALLKEAAQTIMAIAGTLSHLETFLDKLHSGKDNLPHITVDQALNLPSMKNSAYWRPVVDLDPSKGVYITHEGELALLQHFGGPVWLTEPYHLGIPFYQAFTDESKSKARCADLLLGYGEVIGLGQRHASASDTLDALNLHEVHPDSYGWYIKIREEKHVLTSGWGIGVERFLAWVLHHDDIRDLTIIPRLKGFTFAP